jgi:bifunctional non-homologous end joining protein LigD
MQKIFLPPQLLATVATPPSGPNWLFQPKFDGHRAQIVLRDGRVAIYSRNGHDRTKLFSSIAPSIREAVAVDALLDAEICVEDAEGRADFGLLCQSLGPGGPFCVRAFDLLELRGQYLVDRPTIERLGRLRELLPASGTISAAETTTDGVGLLKRVRLARGQGIVAKRADAPYRPGERTGDWLKIKLTQRQEFVVAGWHEDTAGKLQSLVLATSSPDGMTFRGCVGTGFSSQQRAELLSAIATHRAEHAPFPRPSGVRHDAKWTAHPLVVDVEYAEITRAGRARHPRFVGVRYDKEPCQVVLEQ